MLNFLACLASQLGGISSYDKKRSKLCRLLKLIVRRKKDAIHSQPSSLLHSKLDKAKSGQLLQSELMEQNQLKPLLFPWQLNGHHSDSVSQRSRESENL